MRIVAGFAAGLVAIIVASATLAGCMLFPPIVTTRLVADLETPVSAKLKLARNARYSILLESVEGGAVRGLHQAAAQRHMDIKQHQFIHEAQTPRKLGHMVFSPAEKMRLKNSLDVPARV